MTLRQGVDLSYAQTGLGYEEMAASGVVFAYVRLTYGTSIRDNQAQTHLDGCRKVGIKVGPYHFYTGTDSPATNAATQAAWFLGSYNEYGPYDMPSAIDIEQTSPEGWAALARSAVEWCDMVETQTRRLNSTIYTNVSFARSLPGWPWGRHVWLADPSNVAPGIPRLITQLAPGPVPGCPSAVDIDHFVGTTAQWAAFTQSPNPTPPPLTQEELMGASIAVRATGRVEIAAVGEGNNRTESSPPCLGRPGDGRSLDHRRDHGGVEHSRFGPAVHGRSLISCSISSRSTRPA